MLDPDLVSRVVERISTCTDYNSDIMTARFIFRLSISARFCPCAVKPLRRKSFYPSLSACVDGPKKGKSEKISEKKRGSLCALPL